VYYFDPAEFTIIMGDRVVVETARGVEYGEVAVGARDVPEEQVIQPLKKVLRLGTEKDAQLATDNKRKEHEAFGVAQKKIDAHGLEMSLVDVEYTFDGSKIIFYFTAEGRVDFRELVRDLAGVFRTRIEMRQIGVRDEAKLLGGIGPCGRILCCTSFLGDFAPVSIRMAKDQNLSLNPSKISGLCGRLMCCLRYEQETYELAKKDPTLAPGYVPPVLLENGNVQDLVELEDRPVPRIILRSEGESGPDARIAQVVAERPRRDERPAERRGSGGERQPGGVGGERRERPKQRPQGERPQGERPQGERPQGERPQGGPRPQPQGEGGKRPAQQPVQQRDKQPGQAAQQRDKQRGQQPRQPNQPGGGAKPERQPGERPQGERPQGERQQRPPRQQQGGGLTGAPAGGGKPQQATRPAPQAGVPAPGPTQPVERAGEERPEGTGAPHRRRRHRGRRHGGGGGNPQGGGDGGSPQGGNSAE
jgi:cell fate regulator YaaT (PSP1 superfamily)